jgi:hypothetical protein
VTSWGYTSIELSLYVDTEAVRLSYFKENGEWEYQGSEMYKIPQNLHKTDVDVDVEGISPEIIVK